MRLSFIQLVLTALIVTLMPGCAFIKISEFDQKPPPKLEKSSKFQGVAFDIELLPNPDWQEANRQDIETVLSYYGAHVTNDRVPAKIGDFRISMKITSPESNIIARIERTVEVNVLRKEIDGWFPLGQQKSYTSVERGLNGFAPGPLVCMNSRYGCFVLLEGGEEFFLYVPTFSTALVTILNEIPTDTAK